jgi:O-antigen ligase
MNGVTSTRWWESRLAGRLHLLLALALLPVLIRLAMEEDLTWMAGAIVGLAVCIITAVRWPYGAIFVVVAMSAMPVYFVELFGWKARPEHFGALIVSGAVCLWLFFSKSSLQWNRLDWWILAYVIINFISSAVGSTNPASTLRWALQNSLAVAAYFLIRILIRDVHTLRTAFRILVGVGAFESLYGIFCYVSYHISGTTFGMSVGQYLVNVAAPFGSMYEPNLFGAYAGCCAILFLALYLTGRHRLLSSIGFLVAALATLLSFSRAAFLALVVASVWVFWKTRHARSSGRSKLTTPVLVLAVILVIALTAVGGILKERFADLYYQGLTEETAISRFVVIEQALQEIPSHPILGSGTASFNLSFDWTPFIPEWSSDKTWIGNAPIRILHDTGLIGLCAFAGFFISVGWKLRLIWKRTGVPDGLTLGLAAGALLYAVAFQFTDSTSLAFFWVHMGFLGSAAILYQENGPVAAEGPVTAIA